MPKRLTTRAQKAKNKARKQKYRAKVIEKPGKLKGKVNTISEEDSSKELDEVDEDNDMNSKTFVAKGFRRLGDG